MGFFRRFFGSIEPAPPKDARNPYVQLGQIISGKDEITVSMVTADTENHGLYLAKIAEGKISRDLNEKTSPDLLSWFALIDALIENGFAVEIDWKEEPDDILWQINHLAANLVPNLVFRIDQNPSPEGENWADLEPEQVFSRIADQSEAHGYCLYTLDIDADAYVVCLIQVDSCARAKTLVDQTPHRLMSYSSDRIV